MDAASIHLTIPAGIDPARVTGAGDATLRAVEAASPARIAVRGNRIAIEGDADEVELAAALFDQLFARAAAGEATAPEDAARMLAALRDDGVGVGSETLLTHRGRAVRPKTAGQRRYVEAVRSHAVTFCTGPAGTGKTYLAMALAVAALKRREVGRIVLTRPVVEAGESLGFLPGTLEDKVDPYVRPLFDALFDMMDRERAQALVERGVIEIAPLAYMRGRTLSDAYVVLDEAQNTTPAQMKMFLTRLGANARFVVTGDATQRDLPVRASGLAEAEEVLRGVEGIAFVRLAGGDVVRHRLVGRIVEAYDRFDRERGARDGRAHS